MIYEFITPSDPITFKTDNPKVAYFVTIQVGKGQAGCVSETDENLDTFLMFETNPVESIEKFLGMSMDDFIKNNKQEIIECLKSFAYGKINERKQFDLCIESITDKEKLNEFKSKHEDMNRSSLSEWVKYAWKIAKAMEKGE